MSSERQYNADKIAKEFAQISGFNDSECGVLDTKDLQKRLKAKCIQNHTGVHWDPLPDDNLVLKQLKRLPFKHSNADVITGYHKHPKCNAYVYFAIGCEMGYRTNFMFENGKGLCYQWLVSNHSPITTFWTTHNEDFIPEECVDGPTLSIYAISRLHMWKTKFLERYYAPGGKGFQKARLDFNNAI